MKYDESRLPKCPRCGKSDAVPLHKCPYDLEVNNDIPERHQDCQCCDECKVNHCQDAI